MPIISMPTPEQNFQNPETRKQARSLVRDIREAVTKQKEEGVSVPDPLVQRTFAQGRELLGWSNQDLADELGVSDQIAERLQEGKSRPLPAVRKSIVTFMANELTSRYGLESPNRQERKTK
jgi:ribosome-binding protein aMBF1 (putative translation factor)